MIIPLTSTTVATNGVDETAGSKPKRDNMKSDIAPIRTPNKTIDSRLNPMTDAIEWTIVDQRTHLLQDPNPTR